MCGVIGVIGHSSVAEHLVKGADVLQNRGEHSTKIVTYNPSTNMFYPYGGLGTASIVFRNFSVENLPGNSGIGHTRYPTAGGIDFESLEMDAQPVYDAHYRIYTSHNGDVVNLVSARKKLESNGFKFRTTVDAEVIQKSLIQNAERNDAFRASTLEDFVERMFRSVENVQRELVGAYSVVNLLERGLLVFTDPYRIRPLIMAKKNLKQEEYLFASETSVLDVLHGFEYAGEVEAGEAVFVDNKTLHIYRKTLHAKGMAACMFEAVYFSRPASMFFGKRIESIREKLGEAVAREHAYLAREADVVIGIPACGTSAGLELARILGLPYKNAVIKKRDIRSFLETSQERRQKAVEDKLMFIPEFYKGKRIITVDDTNVRGNTALKYNTIFRSTGAKSIINVFYTPKIISQCHYGIDIHDKKELIAANHTLEELPALMNADKVIYPSLKGFKEAFESPGLPIHKMCFACLDGKYPTDVSEAVERSELRIKERASC